MLCYLQVVIEAALTALDIPAAEISIIKDSIGDLLAEWT
jgi:hypothetical protein